MSPTHRLKKLIHNLLFPDYVLSNAGRVISTPVILFADEIVRIFDILYYPNYLLQQITDAERCLLVGWDLVGCGGFIVCSF